MPLKTVLFDMGNVLVLFSHERMCRQIGELFGQSAAEVRTQLLDSGLQWNFERGFVSENEFHRRSQDLFGKTVPLDDLRRAAADIFSPNPGIVQLLDELRALGLRLVLLSNTCITHFEWVRTHSEVLQRFDDFTVSYEAGAIKPEDRIYEVALEKIRCVPEECLYTDDIPEYAAKGRSFGLQAKVFTSVSDLRSALRDLGTPVAAAS